MGGIAIAYFSHEREPIQIPPLPLIIRKKKLCELKEVNIKSFFFFNTF